MKTGDGRHLRIIEIIAAGDYVMFGMCLLQDENGEQVELIKKNYMHDGPQGITEAILKKWLTSGASTCTYQHLIECLIQSQLARLANDISITVGDEGIAYSGHFCITN